jgi:hypothetical protein
MKVLEDDSEARWTMKKLELGCKVTPLSCERNGTIKCVTTTVGKGHETPMPVGRKSVWVGDGGIR